MTNRPVTNRPAPARAEGVTLQFFLDPAGALVGAHTVGLASSGRPELVLPLTADPAQPHWSLTIGEAHDLLHQWAAAFVAGTLEVSARIEVPIEADDALLAVDFPEPVAGTEVDGAELHEASALVLSWTVVPGPSPRPLADGREEFLAGAVNGLRLASGSTPVDEATFDFSPTARFAVATPMVEALADSVLLMDAVQLAAWHGAWTEIVESGYRPDVALATCDAMARRVGREEAWRAVHERADEVARTVLGADGPSELLMETCATLFEEVGLEDDEVRQLLLGRIAVVLHDQIRVLLLSAVVEDVTSEEITVPPLQAWWSGQQPQTTD